MKTVKPWLRLSAKRLALDLTGWLRFTPTNEEDAFANKPPHDVGGQHGRADGGRSRASPTKPRRRWGIAAGAPSTDGLEQLEQLCHHHH